MRPPLVWMRVKIARSGPNRDGSFNMDLTYPKSRMTETISRIKGVEVMWNANRFLLPAHAFFSQKSSRDTPVRCLDYHVSDPLEHLCGLTNRRRIVLHTGWEPRFIWNRDGSLSRYGSASSSNWPIRCPHLNCFTFVMLMLRFWLFFKYTCKVQ